MQGKSTVSPHPCASPSADGTESTIDTLPLIPVANGICVLYGYEVSARIERGHLALADGIMDERREGLLSRATSGLRHLVILGHTGYVTLEALKWLHGLKAAVSVIDADGQVILSTVPIGSDNPALRRAQVLASIGSLTAPGQVLAGGTDAGLSITRSLIRIKLEGQARVARMLGQSETADRIAVCAERLDRAINTDEVRQLEGMAAGLYWQAWQSLPLRYARRDVKRIPEHWRTFGPRSSPIANGPRSAATPGNAILNYLYAILETETRIALLTVGLDPGLGFLHTDQPARDSLALDVMEAVRPDVDAWLLKLLRERTFARSSFFERHDGVCRVTADLARELCTTAPLWRRAVGPVAESVAQMLVQAYKPSRLLPGEGREGKLGCRLPTALSQANRSAGRAAVRRSTVAASEAPRPAMPRACKECGAPIHEGERLFCSDACWEAYNKEVNLPKLTAAGPAALAKQRAEGADPAHGGEAARKRSTTQSERAKQRARWEAEHGDGAAERQRFANEIAPKLADVPLSAIQKAIGCSPRYASLIRRGLYTPHPMHYAALNALAEGVTR